MMELALVMAVVLSAAGAGRPGGTTAYGVAHGQPPATWTTLRRHPLLKTDDDMEAGQAVELPMTAVAREAKLSRLAVLQREVQQLEAELLEDDALLEAEVLAEAVAARRIGANGEDRTAPAPREDSGAGRRDDLRTSKPATGRAGEKRSRVTEAHAGSDSDYYTSTIFAVGAALVGGAGWWRLRQQTSSTVNKAEQEGGNRASSQRLPAGCPVRVQGLARATETNGKHGTIVGFIDVRGRYEVALEGGDHVSLRPQNLAVL